MRTEKEYKARGVENRRLRAALSGAVLDLLRLEAEASEIAKRASTRMAAIAELLNAGARDADG